METNPPLFKASLTRPKKGSYSKKTVERVKNMEDQKIFEFSSFTNNEKH